MTKSKFRTKHKNIRNNLSADLASEKSELIQNKLISMDIVRNAKSVFLYLEYGREVSTGILVEYLLNENKIVLIPKCDIQSETMIAVRFTEQTELTDNIYGIKESTSLQEYTGDIDLVIVPGIAFDKYGNRIGHGKGYYDKFLQNRNLQTIGLCYSENLSDEELPHSDEDIVMDYIVTDREVLRIKP